jgi:PKD repeat protein
MKTKLFHSRKSPSILVLLFLFVNCVQGQTVDFTITQSNACSEYPISFDTINILGFSGNSSNYTFDWDFDDGSPHSNEANPVHVFEAFGCDDNVHFNVTLKITDNSSGEEAYNNHEVSVNERPNPEIENAATNNAIFDNCANAQPHNPTYEITIRNETPFYDCVASATIDWGDGSSEPLPAYNGTKSHTYLELGEYNLIVTAIGENECVGTSTYLVQNDINYPRGSLKISGVVNDSCAPAIYTFYLDTIDPANHYLLNSSTTIYKFNFDDGTPEAILSQHQIKNDSGGIIRHTYKTSSCTKPFQQFRPNLTIINSCFNNDYNEISTGRIFAKPIPIVDPDTINGCEGDTICFNNLSVPGYGWNCSVNDDYFWNFGNGNNSTEKEPCEVYESPDTYNGSLTVSNWCGEKSMDFVVKIDPGVDLIADHETIDEYCVPFNVQFTNASTGGSLTHNWSISPGSSPDDWKFVTGTNNSEEPEIEFISCGEYTVTLAVLNSCETKTQDFLITAKDVPVIHSIDFVSPICVGESVEISCTEDGCYGGALTYNWDFDGGVPSGSTNAPSVQVTFNTATTFSIKLIVSNTDCGQSTEFTKDILVINEPDISGFFLPLSTVVPDDSSLCESDTDIRFGAIINGDYLFLDDGWTSDPDFIQSNGNFTPSQPDTYDIQLIYGETPTCSDTFNITIHVVTNPLVSAGDNIALCEGDISIIDLDLDTGATPPGGDWDSDPDDGSLIDSGSNWFFDPTLAGDNNYTLTYTFTDPVSKCEGSDFIEITIDAEPDSDFTYSPSDDTVCVPKKFIFNPANNPLNTKYFWSINGGSEISVENYEPTFSDPGIYEIKLRVTSPNDSCSSSSSKTIIALEPPPEPDFTLSKDTVCGSEQVTITPLFAYDNGSSDWLLDGDPWPFSGVISFTPGNYSETHTLDWILNNDCGTKTTTRMITVLPVPISFIRIDSSNVYSKKITFVNESVNYTTCEWILPDGEKIESCYDVTVDIEQGEEYIITLVTYNNQTCYDDTMVSYKKTFKSLYIPTAFIPSSTDTLVNKFNAVGAGLLSYHLAVYDTWGSLIWETSLIEDGEPAEGWDGTDGNGKDLPQDVYIWYAQAVFIDGSIWQGQDGSTAGNVTLLR